MIYKKWFVLGISVVSAAIAIVSARGLLLPEPNLPDPLKTVIASASPTSTSEAQPSSTPAPSPSCLTGGKLVDGSCVYPVPTGKPISNLPKKQKARTMPGEKFVPFVLKEGDCFDRVEKIHEVAVVAIDCSQPHTAQVLGLNEGWTSYTTFYDVVYFTNIAKGYCSDLDIKVDASWNWVDDDNIQIGLIYPSPASYNKGENLGGCYLYNTAGSFTGSFLEPKPSTNPTS